MSKPQKQKAEGYSLRINVGTQHLLQDSDSRVREIRYFIIISVDSTVEQKQEGAMCVFFLSMLTQVNFNFLFVSFCLFVFVFWPRFVLSHPSWWPTKPAPSIIWLHLPPIRHRRLRTPLLLPTRCTTLPCLWPIQSPSFPPSRLARCQSLPCQCRLLTWRRRWRTR